VIGVPTGGYAAVHRLLGMVLRMALDHRRRQDAQVHGKTARSLVVVVSSRACRDRRQRDADDQSQDEHDPAPHGVSLAGGSLVPGGGKLHSFPH
jgi:hypothetical protein